MTDATSIVRPSASESSSEEAYERIRRAILDGTLRPGDRIIEQRIAKVLEVSRTPVREALLKLERENLVARSGRGMAVRTFSAGEVCDIYDLRALLESYAARRAAARITRGEIGEMRRVQEQLLQATEAPKEDEFAWQRDLARLNQHFHNLVIRAARSEPLARVISGVGQTPLIYKAYLWYGDDELRRSAAGHDRLIELLERGDEHGAEAWWREHIAFGRDVLVDRLTAHESHVDAGF